MRVLARHRRFSGRLAHDHYIRLVHPAVIGRRIEVIPAWDREDRSSSSRSRKRCTEMNLWGEHRWSRLSINDDARHRDAESGQKICELGVATCDETVHGFACDATGLGFFCRHSFRKDDPDVVAGRHDEP
jgi:hypothetical protein